MADLDLQSLINLTPEQIQKKLAMQQAPAKPSPWQMVPDASPVVGEVPDGQGEADPNQPAPMPKVAAQPPLAPKNAPASLHEAPAEDVDKELARQLRASMGTQRDNMSTYQSQLDKLQKQGDGGINDVNLKPLMALADSWTGSKLAQSYDGPPNQAKKAAQILALQKAYDAAQTGLDKTQVNYLNMDANKQKAQENFLLRQQMMQNQKNNHSDVEDRWQNRLDDTDHRSVLSALNKNPQLAARINQAQNLDNAFAAFDKAELTPAQQFNEFQQAIRNNMGIKGSSGVAERADDYFHSMGIDASKWKQYLTGDPQDLGKDNKLAQHLKDLSHVERANIQQQIQDHMDALSEGHASMYERRPDLKKDLDRALSAQKRRVGNSPILNSGGPAPGTIEDGHRFKGGDPKIQANWEPVP